MKDYSELTCSTHDERKHGSACFKESEESKTLIVMSLELVKRQNESIEVESNYDPNLRWKLKRFLDYGKEVFKELNT